MLSKKKIVLKVKIIMSLNVWQDNVFWSATPLVTRRGMAIHHSKPKCHAGGPFGILVVTVSMRAHIWEYECFYNIYRTADLLTLKRDRAVRYNKPKSQENLLLLKRLVYSVKRHGLRFNRWFFWIISREPLSCNQTWNGEASTGAVVSGSRLICCRKV